MTRAMEIAMTDTQWAEIMAWLRKNGCELIVPLTGPVVIRPKANLA
jgi:hypothetical protein